MFYGESLLVVLRHVLRKSPIAEEMALDCLFVFVFLVCISLVVWNSQRIPKWAGGKSATSRYLRMRDGLGSFPMLR